MFKKNEGSTDRIVRVILGAALLSLVFTGPQSAWGYVGVIPLFTGMIGSCPAYQLLGISTCPLEKRR
jgi:hypothetical protein